MPSRGRHRDDDEDYENEYTRAPHRRYSSPVRSKSRTREALADIKAGHWGDALDTITRSRSRSRSTSEYYAVSPSPSPSRYRRRSEDGGKWRQAAEAAIAAGAVEAFRVRKQPGSWTGEKGVRVATAALSAAAIDGFLDKNPNRKSKRHIAEAAIGGLMIDRIANGPRRR